MNSEHIMQENAVRLCVFDKAVPLLDYVKEVASLVGSSHIIAVFQEEDNIKMYFDDRKIVDILVKEGVQIKGRYVFVEYAVPPGLKVTMNELDPAIPDTEVHKLLSHYGSVVSPIYRPPICDISEFCHITHGTRYVYMKLNSNLPSSVSWKCGSQWFQIKANVENDEMPALPVVKLEPVDEHIETGSVSGNLSSEIPRSLSVSIRNIGKNTANRSYCVPKKASAITEKATAVKKSYLKNSLRSKYKSRGPRKDYTLRKASSSKKDQIVGNYSRVLTEDQLKKFLKEIKNRRGGISILKRYANIKNDRLPSKLLLNFIQQLKDYQLGTPNGPLKVRLSRLIEKFSKYLK